MFQLNKSDVENSENFQERAKYVFEALSDLESNHRAFQSQILLPDCLDLNIENIDLNKQVEFEFKIPALPPVSAAKRPRNNLPDHVRYPHKWKRYSLEDVPESAMSPSGNRTAALSFLRTINQSRDDVEMKEDKSASLEFDRPIGQNRFRALNSKLTEADGEEEEREEEIEINLTNTFKKRNKKKVLRKKMYDEDLESEEMDLVIAKKVNQKKSKYHVKVEEEEEELSNAIDDSQNNEDYESEFKERDLF